MAKTTTETGKLALLYIEWCDAMVNQDSWVKIADMKEWAATDHWITYDVGFLIEETKEYILLASRYTINDDGTNRVDSCIKIPTTWIRKRKVIKV